DKMMQNGVLYHGMAVMGGGAILGGLILAAIAVFVIERQLYKAAVTSGIAAVLTFFGFMHGEAIGIAQTPTVAVAYVGVALFLFGCAKFATTTAEAAPESEPEAHHAVPEPAE